jgi:sporulation-control protein
MILRKYMSLIGIGAAEVDLVLEKTRFSMEDSIKGRFLIKGGTIRQQIKRLECDLVMYDDVNKCESVIDSITILSSKMIEAEECYEIPFSYQLPSTISASSNNRSYRFVSRIVFDEGVKSKDEDEIIIF